MPIKAILRWYYPIDWQELSAFVVLATVAKSIVDLMERPSIILVMAAGSIRLTNFWRNDRGQEIAWPAYRDYAALKQMKVILAVAHLDHNPSNNQVRNLKALCQRCHLRQDRKEHQRRVLGDLSDGPYPA